MDFDNWKSAVQTSLVQQNSSLAVNAIDSRALAQAFAADVAPSVAAKLVLGISPNAQAQTFPSHQKLLNPTGITISYILSIGSSIVLWVCMLANLFVGASNAGRASSGRESSREPAMTSAIDSIVGSIWTWTFAGSLILFVLGTLFFILSQVIREYALRHN